MGRKYNLVGNKYNMLTVLSDSGERAKDGAILWKCICECGTTLNVRTQSLTVHNQKSCGCIKSESIKQAHTTHGMNETRLYRIWDGMKQRVYNPNAPMYKYYGGKGVVICKEWHGFQGFRKWAESNGYKDNLTIDRIDVNGNYEPGNCRWVTQRRQSRNTTKTRWVTFKGKKMSMKDASELAGIKYYVLQGRIYRNDPEELWFLQPDEYKKRKELIK